MELGGEKGESKQKMLAGARQGAATKHREKGILFFLYLQCNREPY